MDRVSLLTVLTVFLLSAGPDVCAVEPLHTLCLQRFTASMDAKDPQVSTTERKIQTGRENLNDLLTEKQKVSVSVSPTPTASDVRDTSADTCDSLITSSLIINFLCRL